MKKVPIERRYYERIPNETIKAWLAFCLYRDLGAGRSLDTAYRQQTGKSNRHSRHWATWSKKNHWVKRVDAYDEMIAKKKRRAVEDERIENYRNTFGRYW